MLKNSSLLPGLYSDINSFQNEGKNPSPVLNSSLSSFSVGSPLLALSSLSLFLQKTEVRVLTYGSSFPREGKTGLQSRSLSKTNPEILGCLEKKWFFSNAQQLVSLISSHNVLTLTHLALGEHLWLIGPLHHWACQLPRTTCWNITVTATKHTICLVTPSVRMRDQGAKMWSVSDTKNKSNPTQGVIAPSCVQLKNDSCTFTKQRQEDG